MRIFVFMHWGGFGDGVAGKRCCKCMKMPQAADLSILFVLWSLMIMDDGE
jgi:hypothetical protein